MQFSEAQEEDLLLLRRLFYGKLGVLSRERKDCLKRMPFGAASTAAEVNGRLSEVIAIAQELHDITAEEFQTKLQFTSAYRRGVRDNLYCCKFELQQAIFSVILLALCKLLKRCFTQSTCSSRFRLLQAG